MLQQDDEEILKRESKNIQKETTSWWRDILHLLSFKWVFPPFG